MKRVITSLALCSVALSGLALTTFAADDIRTSKTEADITFEAGGGENVVPTPDPNPDPNEEKDPDPDPQKPDPEGEGHKGALRFTYVPNISFGKTTLIAQTQNYYADFVKKMYTKADGSQVEGLYPTFFTVEDVRGGSKGWSASVKHDGKWTNGSDTINGTLWLKNPSIESGTFKADDANLAVQKPEFLATATEGQYFNISTNSDVKLVAANVGQGYGKWSVGYGATDVVTTGYGLDGNVAVPADTPAEQINAKKKGKNPAVKLEVPAQVINTDDTKAKYETTLTWTISNVF